MNEDLNMSQENMEMEMRLWDYIDGSSSIEERTVIEKLVASNGEWKKKYHELLETHSLMQSVELDHPSMRFTKNVMEEIAKYKIAPAAKTYINKRVIWGIGIFFITMLVGLVIYGFGQIDWNAGSDSGAAITDQLNKVNQVDYSKFFNNTYVNVFMMINVVLGLFLFDRYLTMKKNKAEEA